MKNIASRVTDLEDRMGVVRDRRNNAEADDAFERLMADDQGQAAVLASPCAGRFRTVSLAFQIANA